MRKLSKQEILLLNLAAKNNGQLFLTQITPKVGISIKDAAIAYISLNKAGFFTNEDNILKLTDLGASWVNENQFFFQFRGEKTWRIVPERFCAPSILPETPYAPRRSLIRKKFIGR